MQIPKLFQLIIDCKMKLGKLQTVLLLLTGFVFAVFCFYIKDEIAELKRNVYIGEQKVGTLEIENFELNEILNTIYETDWNTYDSVVNRIPIEGNSLILRITENTCLNCYFKGLKNSINVISDIYGDKFHFIVLGKYRFKASCLNDVKDFIDDDIDKMNFEMPLPLDELDAPYLLYFDERRNLGKFFVFEKGDAECVNNFLGSLSD